MCVTEQNTIRWKVNIGSIALMIPMYFDGWMQVERSTTVIPRMLLIAITTGTK
jgi:hypothetical protein